MDADPIPVFDAHMHSAGIFLRRGAAKLSILEYMDQQGIEKGLVNPVQPSANMKDMQTMLAGGIDPQTAFPFEDFVHEPHFTHEDVKALVDAAPDRIYGSFWFNPSYARECDRTREDPFKPLERALDDWHFRAVKVQPTIHKSLPTDLEELAGFLEERNVPLFVHMSPGFFAYRGVSPIDLLDLARGHPELPLIVGHFTYAMEVCIESLVLASQCPNVYLDTSVGIPYGILMAYQTLGPDRILFGSDGPAAGPAKLEVEKVRLLDAPVEHKRKILYDNAVRLFSA